MPLSFVVTGCGRSGTGYTSHLFQAMGIRCGHESVFNYGKAKKGFTADSSWMATPLLLAAPQPELKVLHQIRNPVRVIRSMVGGGSFDKPDDLYNQFADRHMESHFEPGDSALVKCMKFWLYWNQMAARLYEDHRYFRYRLEDMPVGRIVDFLDLGIPSETVDRAVRDTGKTVNSRPRCSTVSWASFIDNGLKQAIAFQAAEYGYLRTDLESA